MPRAASSSARSRKSRSSGLSGAGVSKRRRSSARARSRPFRPRPPRTRAIRSTAVAQDRGAVLQRRARRHDVVQQRHRVRLLRRGYGRKASARAQTVRARSSLLRFSARVSQQHPDANVRYRARDRTGHHANAVHSALANPARRRRHRHEERSGARIVARRMPSSRATSRRPFLSARIASRSAPSYAPSAVTRTVGSDRETGGRLGKQRAHNPLPAASHAAHCAGNTRSRIRSHTPRRSRGARRRTRAEALVWLPRE